MDEAQQDQYEAQLREVFDSFDASGSGSLCQAELSALCQALHLEDVAPTLLHPLLPQEDHHTGRVTFEQFKDALILLLSNTLEGHSPNQEDCVEADCTEVHPKFVKDGKRYGRRSTPEFADSITGFSEVIDTGDQPADTQNATGQKDQEHRDYSTRSIEEYEAEGQLHLWNPDDPCTPRGGLTPSPDWLEERLQGVCEALGVSWDGCASSKDLLSVCEQLDLEVMEDVVQKLDSDGVMSVQDFVSRVLNHSKPPTPSASTPYRQLKRHHSTQPFDESGRRTATPSAMTSTIGLRLFSFLDDGSGYTAAERLLDAWQVEGIENSPEILEALDFSMEGKVHLSELTIALENELLITKNGIHQAVLASFKAEIRHLLERVDRELREKEKLRSDLEKADKLKTQMATEVDEHHSAIERLNDHNLRKLEQEHRDRLAAVRAELTRDLDHIQQQASCQRADLEREVEKVKEEEAFLRDRLSLTLKENGRLEAELLENTEKLVESENLVSKLQRNLDNILKEKFGDLDPGSAEFFLQEERLKSLRREYEEQCRELQDRIDELQVELEEYRTLGRTTRPCLNPSLSEEFDNKSPGIESDLGLGSEDCPPFNMSLEAEMLMEQLKDQHLQDVEILRAELESKVNEFQQQLGELRAAHEQEQNQLAQRCKEETQALQENLSQAQSRVTDLQGRLDAGETQREKLEECIATERAELENRHVKEVSAVREETSCLQARVCQLEEQLRDAESERKSMEQTQASERTELERLHSEERAKLEQQHEEALQAQLEAERQRMLGEQEERERMLTEEWERQRASLEERHREAVQELNTKQREERERLTGLLDKLRQDTAEERKELENHFSQRIREVEARFSGDQVAVLEQFKVDVSKLEERYQKELKDLSEQHLEEKAQWEFEKEEILQEGEEEREHLREELEREKESASLEFANERDLMEKSYKEQLAKNQQLQKELEDHISTAQFKDTELRKQLSDLHKELQTNLEAKDYLLIQAERKAEDLDLLLHQAVEDFEQEKVEMQGQLTDLEDKNKKNLTLVEKQVEEKEALVAEISQLTAKIQELEAEAAELSKLREDFEESKKENEEAFCTVSHLKRRIEELEAETEWLTSMKQEDERDAGNLNESIMTPGDESTESQVPELKDLPDDLEAGFLQEKLIQLEKQDELIPQLLEECEHNVREHDSCTCEMLELCEKVSQLQDQAYITDELQSQLECVSEQNLELKKQVSQLQERTVELQDILEDNSKKIATGEQAEKENKALRLDMSKMMEWTKELEDKALQLMDLQSRYDECIREKSRLEEGKVQLEGKVQDLEEKMQDIGDFQDQHAGFEMEMARITEENSKLCLQIQELKKQEEVLNNLRQDTEKIMEVAEWKAKKETFHELNSQLEAKIQAVSELEDSCAVFERENTALRDNVTALQEKSKKLEEKMQAHRTEAGRLVEENLILKREISALKDDRDLSQEKLKDLSESQGEMQHKIEHIRKEKMATQKMAENLKKQVSELRSRGQQLEDENGLLSHKNAQNAADVLELNRRLSELLRQRERKEGGRRHHLQGELERERAALTMELAQERNKMAARLSGLESELADAQQRNTQMEQERALLSQKLTTLKEQLCAERDLGTELADAVLRSEKLQKEKDTLSDELSRCVDKVAKLGAVESQLSHLRHERQAMEQQAQGLRTQLCASQEKVQSLENALQTVNLQSARLKSDLRVIQQEKEALKQEVMSLHKQLQNSNDKNQVLEVALNSSGFQNQHKKLFWDELSRLVEQEQQLLRLENERLQQEVQTTKGDLNHSRDKTRQLESTILSLKQQKQQGQSSLVKAVEQEKLSLKRELESLRKELLMANRKASDQSEGQRELDSLRQENDNLKTRQARMESQLLEALQVQLGARVPREQLVQAQHRLLQAERRGQHRGEELAGRGPDINLQQGEQEVMLLKMEERMRDVEQKLRNIKLLLQEKVVQLKDQLQKNAKADEMIKDLYVENSQLLKALEMTEQRQKVAEKKNYLLEEKISSLNKIVRDLSPSPLTAVPYHFTRS
ncbi:NIN protein, partial [Amia calva]|nr:NIN protein [Amia calva]